MAKTVSISAVAEKVGVSRMTVWRALNGQHSSKVSDETMGRIHTAMNELQAGAVSKKSRRAAFVSDEKIYWLSPSVNLVGSDKSIKDMLDGVIERTTSLGIKLEITPISMRNDNVTLDWELLSHLQRGSRVIVSTHWMNWALLELSSRGCHIVQIAENSYFYRLLRRYSEDWMTLLIRRDIGNRLVMQHLWNQGCRRPALSVVRRYMSEPDYLPLKVYDDFLREKGIAYRNIIAYESSEDLCECVRKGYKDNPFDGLCTNSGTFDLSKTLEENMGVPAGTPVVFRGSSPCALQMNMPYSCYDYKEAGRRAVDILAKPDFTPGVQDVVPCMVLPNEQN